MPSSLLRMVFTMILVHDGHPGHVILINWINFRSSALRSRRSKAVGLLLLTFCWLLLPLWESAIVLCFIVRYFMSILVLQSSWWGSTGPCSAVGNVSGNRCESACRSRGREFDPGPVPYFRGVWSWNNFYGHSPPFCWINQEGLLSVTSESMCTKYWLTACSSLPRKKCG